MKCRVEFRKQVVINTDPQRRCYDGCNFSERIEWTPWKLVFVARNKEDAEGSCATFKSINPGHEYRIVGVEASHADNR